MSEHASDAAVARMNLNVVAVSTAHSSLASDLMRMSRTDPVEAQAKFLEEGRAELCSAYGFTQNEQRKPFAFAGGVAIIPIHGSLINRFGGSYGYVTGYNFIKSQLALALADEDVKGIVYDVNSFGGEAAGMLETAAAIRAANKTKPSISVVDSNAYSAGYGLACSAGKMVMTPSGGGASIGVVAMHVNMQKLLADIGYEITFITFGAHKVDGNPYEALSEPARKRIQASVNKTGRAFTGLVAKHRDIDEQIVLDTEAACLRADEMLSLGLIDAIATPEEAVQAFLGELSGSNPQPRKKEDAMSDPTTQPGATNTPAVPAAAAPAAAAPAAAPAAASTPDVATAQAEARTAERARMSGILGCEEAKGRESLANHFAMNTGMSVDEAKAALAAAPKAEATKPAAGATGFEAAMNRTGNPNVGAEGGGGEGGGEGATAVEQILASQQRATGFPSAKK